MKVRTIDRTKSCDLLNLLFFTSFYPLKSVFQSALFSKQTPYTVTKKLLKEKPPKKRPPKGETTNVI